MKKWFWLLNILALLSLAACQAGKETVVERHYIPTSSDGPIPAPPKTEQGGIDGAGGGNGVQGKPLESFQVDLNSVSAFQKLRLNVINKLAPRLPRLAADLLHIAEERTWYIIPIELKKLPSFKIGTFFPTEQYALQGTKEVWMSDLYFSDMKPKDQQKLILHELLMGVRLLEFTNILDQCLVGIAVGKLPGADPDLYSENRRDCFHKNRDAADLGDSVGIGRSIELSDDDYQSIRYLAGLLIDRAASVNAKEIEDYMAINKFRRY
jgi:hypothetical protein